MKQIYIIIFLSAPLIAQEPFWVKTNGPDGGLVENIFINDYSNTLFAGTYLDGIYYSTNYGESWLKASLNNKTIFCFDALNSNILFAGSDGLYKSLDGGINWDEVVGEFSNNQIRDILIWDEDNLFIATVGKGIYLSTDQGISWEQKNSGLNNNSIYCMDFDSNQIIVCGSSGNGLFKSTDYGENWSSINSPDNSIGKVRFDENNNLYVIAINKLYYSTNYGLSWENISTSLPNANFRDILLLNNFIYASTSEGIFLTSDNGNSWTDISIGLYSSYKIINNVINKNANLYCSTIGGIITSEIGSYEWNKINNNLSIHIIRSVFEKNEKIYVGTSSNELFYTNDKGNSWNNVNYDFGSYITSYSSNLFGHIFLGSISNGMFRSTNDGTDWENIGLVNDAIISIGINSIGYIFVGTVTDGVYFSNNNGNSWEIRNNGLLNIYIKDLKISPENRIYVAPQAGIYSSTDNGNNWALFGLQNKNISCFALLDSETVYACTYGEVYKTTDGGLNWVAINVGLPNSGIEDIKIDVLGNLYIATEKGVYRSIDEGINWEAVNEGLINTHVSTLLIDQDNFIYCGTRGGGLFKSQHPLAVINEDDFSLNYHLSQNFPNPFNPTTILQYSIGSRQFVTLKVYDLLGREVSTLVNEEKPAGTYEIEFDGSNLTSGVYFYRLQARSFSETKKLVLMK